MFIKIFSFMLGVFTFLNAIHRFLGYEQSANLWWVDLSFLPSIVQTIIALMAATSLLGLAFSSVFLLKKNTVKILFIGIIPLFVGCVVASVLFYQSLYQGAFYTGAVIPFSVYLGVGLLRLFISGVRGRFFHENPFGFKDFKMKDTLKMGFFILLFSFFIPMLQVLSLANLDQRQKANVIIVFGARVLKDGRLSKVLENRVQTAYQLYHQGYARTLFFSGGPGEGSIDEVVAMRNFAIQLGVKPQDIILDFKGITTWETVKNVLDFKKSHHVEKMLVVSSFTHLARIKVLFSSQGQNIDVVPALGQKPVYDLLQQLVRESYLLWRFYVGLG